MPDRQPHRRLLALLGHRLAHRPPAPRRLRHRLRPRSPRWTRRPDLRRHRLLRLRPGEPQAGHPTPRRRTGRAPLDHILLRHDHRPPRGAAGELVQDHRRPRRRGPHRPRRLHHPAVRVQRHRPQRLRPRLRPRRQRQRPQLPHPLRLPFQVRRGRHIAVRREERVDRPLLAVALHGRADRRDNGVDGDHHLEQLLLEAQRGDAAGSQRRLPARLGDAGDDRVQPFRGGAGAEDAEVPEGVHPRGEQRFHGVADVRHRREREPDHQQPGESVHGAVRSPCQRGDKESGNGRERVEQLELEDRRRHNGQRRLLRAVRCRTRGQVRQSRERRPQIGSPHRPAHHERRCARCTQGKGGDGLPRHQLRWVHQRRRRRHRLGWGWWRRRKRIHGDGIWEQRISTDVFLVETCRFNIHLLVVLVLSPVVAG